MLYFNANIYLNVHPQDPHSSIGNNYESWKLSIEKTIELSAYFLFVWKDIWLDEFNYPDPLHILIEMLKWKTSAIDIKNVQSTSSCLIKGKNIHA